MNPDDLPGDILLAVLDRAARGPFTEDGSLTPEAQAEVEAIAALASDDPEEMAALAAELAGEEVDEGEFAEGQPCKKGEAAAKTGCVPAGGQSGKKGGSVTKEGGQPSLPKGEQISRTSPERKGTGKLFATTAEAEQHVASSGVADKANLAGATPSQASAIVDGLERSAQAAGHTFKIRSIEIVDKMPVSGDPGGLGYSDGRIYVTKDFLEAAQKHDRAAVEKSLEGTGGKRNMSNQIADTPEEYIVIGVAHEMGHHIVSALLLSEQKGVRDLRDSGVVFEEADMVQVSGFASTHPAELFAEVHALISTGYGDELPEKAHQYYRSALATADPEPLDFYLRKPNGP